MRKYSQNGSISGEQKTYSSHRKLFVRTASEDGTAISIFGMDGRRSSPFVTHMSRIAENVARNPMRHVIPSVTRLPGFNNALEIIANGGRNAANANAFAAYFMQESFGSLFDTRS